ncbi:Protein CBG25354 [Caenorhabditis briggsae]|nr:Protein CBG25354 [Caenorhabditis briggsae]CAR99748.1 Protein CBG25354 [Caenorhabditis briggsae]
MEEGPRRNGTDMENRQEMPEEGQDRPREMESEILPGKEGGNPSEEATSVTSGGIVFGGVFATITALSYLF